MIILRESGVGKKTYIQNFKLKKQALGKIMFCLVITKHTW